MVRSNVLAHIAGPSGSGKSTLLLRLKHLYPTLVVKDLDEFDDEAEIMLGFSTIKKRNYTDSMLTELALHRQRLLDDFLFVNKNSNVVLGGHHTE